MSSFFTASFSSSFLPGKFPFSNPMFCDNTGVANATSTRAPITDLIPFMLLIKTRYIYKIPGPFNSQLMGLFPVGTTAIVLPEHLTRNTTVVKSRTVGSIKFNRPCGQIAGFFIVFLF
jgi:hypothetical protein